MTAKILAYLLRPFGRSARYVLLKIMKKFGPPDDGRRIIAACDHLLQEFILPSVFWTFRDEKFRELAQFKKLPVSEHDRIFNELEVAGVCVALFHIEAVKPFMNPEDFRFWRGVEERLTRQLQRFLIGLGISGSDAKLVRQLIKIRYEEYDELAEMARSVTAAENPEYNELAIVQKRLASVIQGIAIGTTDHVRRGRREENKDGRDPLVSYLVSRLLKLDHQLTKFVRRL